MHRIDTTGHVGNMFDEGDPGVPRLPTVIDSEIMNALMMEIANVITPITALVKNTNNQLMSVLRSFEFGDATAPIKKIRNTLAERALYLVGAGTTAAQAVLDVVNGATGPAANMVSTSVLPTQAVRNTGNGPALELESVDARATLKLKPIATIPSLNGAGAVLGSGDKGLMCFCTVNDKLNVWDGATWQPCW